MATPQPEGHDSKQSATPGKQEAAVICAWCKTILNAGEGPPSHGVCLACLEPELNIHLVDLEEFRQGRSDVA